MLSNEDTVWDYSIFWKEALQQIREEISEQEWVMWFNNIDYDESKQNTIIVSVPSAFYKDQVKQRYLKLIESKLSELSGSGLSIDFVIKKKAQAKPVQSAEKTRQQTAETPQAKLQVRLPGLKENYTFTNFIIGENNAFAANAAMAIAKNPGTAYNPCLIYGGVGLGKTHLIQAIGHATHESFENLKIVYVTAESFMNEFVVAIGDKTIHKFKNKYRNVDVLLIDDIHFLENKGQTQEELFHTFNALYDANKQMVFTCDRPVSELKNLMDRLRSRFERGLNVDLKPPNFETRFAILKKKAETGKMKMSDEIIELISKNITSNVRDLEAAQTKLVAYSNLLGKEITVEIAMQQLKDAFSSPKQSNINLEIIQRVVADYFNLSHNDLRGKKRTKAIAYPRQIAMYIAREITEYSTTEIGLEFGGRDHTTVMHASQRIEAKLKSDPTLEPLLKSLISRVKESGTKT
jgi:chromosomal replication initiator protein